LSAAPLQLPGTVLAAEGPPEREDIQMADDKTVTGEPDLNRISLFEDRERRDWCLSWAARKCS